MIFTYILKNEKVKLKFEIYIMKLFIIIMKLKKLIKTIIREYLNEQVNNANSKYFSNIGLKTEDVFDMIEYHDSFKDLYPNYGDTENEYEEDYYFPTKEDVYNNVNETLEFFNSLPNPIPIYRSIKVKSMEDIDFDYLGSSWSFSKQSAVNFAKNQAGGNVLLIAKTKFNNVDWNNTVKLYYLFSMTFDGYDEDEINIIDSDKIFDIKTEKIN